MQPFRAQNRQKVWFITGCSSGLGRALARFALERGDSVAASARDPNSLRDLRDSYGERVCTPQLDVTVASQARAAIDAALERFGRIDALVNNAGYGLQGAVEDVSDEQIRANFETNVFGVLNVIRAALPALRGQGAGHILNVSSVGGRAPAPFIGMYAATKFAIEGLSLSLAAELAPLGIKVTAIEPGAFATRFGTTSLVSVPPSQPYTNCAREIETLLANMRFADPAGAARVIAAAADMAAPPRQLPVGSDAVDLIRSTLEAQLVELNKWEGLSRSGS